MSEYIIWESDKTETTDYLGVKHGVSHFEKREEIVRCRDCIGLVETWDGWECERFSGEYHRAEPDGFCAWGERANFATCECGEDIELGNRESAVCPRCNRTVIA